MFRLAISGPNKIKEILLLSEAIGEMNIDPKRVTSVVIGGSQGVDALGRRWAHKNALPVLYKFADFKNHGKFAVRNRNLTIANVSDGLLCLWDTICPHTEDLIKQFRSKKKPYYIHMVSYE